MKAKSWALAFLSAAMILLLAACGAGGPSPPQFYSILTTGISAGK